MLLACVVELSSSRHSRIIAQSRPWTAPPICAAQSTYPENDIASYKRARSQRHNSSQQSLQYRQDHRCCHYHQLTITLHLASRRNLLPIHLWNHIRNSNCNAQKNRVPAKNNPDDPCSQDAQQSTAAANAHAIRDANTAQHIAKHSGQNVNNQPVLGSKDKVQIRADTKL